MSPKNDPLTDILDNVTPVVKAIEAEEKQLLAAGSSDPVTYVVACEGMPHLEGSGTAFWDVSAIRVEGTDGSIVFNATLASISGYRKYNWHTIRLVTQKCVCDITFPLHEEYQKHVLAIRKRVSETVAPFLAASQASLPLSTAGNVNQFLINLPENVSQQYMSHAVRWIDSLDASSIPNIEKAEVAKTLASSSAGVHVNRTTPIILLIVLLIVIVVIVIRIASGLNPPV
ncbi:MAG: hypothetical protein ACP5OR_05230 [Candidatus Dormibacteria bacterium]